MTKQYICNECGEQFDKDHGMGCCYSDSIVPIEDVKTSDIINLLQPINPIKCPLCGEQMEYSIQKGIRGGITHYYTCKGETCPAVLLEYMGLDDTNNLHIALNK